MDILMASKPTLIRSISNTSSSVLKQQHSYLQGLCQSRGTTGVSRRAIPIFFDIYNKIIIANQDAYVGDNFVKCLDVLGRGDLIDDTINISTDTLELSGIIVLYNKGTSSIGHFVSYIKSGTKWYLANDAVGLLQFRPHGKPNWDTSLKDNSIASMHPVYVNTRLGIGTNENLHGMHTFRQENEKICGMSSIQAVLTYSNGLSSIIPTIYRLYTTDLLGLKQPDTISENNFKYVIHILRIMIRRIHSWKDKPLTLTEFTASHGRTQKLMINNSEGNSYRTILKGHSLTIWSVCIAGTNIVSASSDTTLNVWDIVSGKSLKVLRGHEAEAWIVCALTDNIIASGSEDKTVRIWDILSGTCLKVLSGHTGGVHGICRLTDNRIVSASSDKTLRTWNIDTGMSVQLEGHTATAKAVCKLNDNQVVSGSYDKTLRIWDLTTGTSKVLNGHMREVVDVVRLNENKVVSGSLDKTLRVWNVLSGVCERVIEGHTGAISGLAVINENKVVSSSWDKTLRVWNIETGECLQILEGHMNYVQCVSVINEDKVVSGSLDKTVRIWDLTAAQAGGYRKKTRRNKLTRKRKGTRKGKRKV